MPRDDSTETDGGESVASEEASDVRERLEQQADRAVEQFDESVVELLSWVLDTETRARIFVFLRKQPHSTSEEVAEGTGLYPSTVREALAELHEEDKVTREKRESSGAGNNPYEYAAMPPSDLVGEIVEDVQEELNTVFNLDRYLGDEETETTESEPVTITVQEADEDGPSDTGISAEEANDGDDETDAGDEDQ